VNNHLTEITKIGMENQSPAGILCEKGVILGSFGREYMMEVTHLFNAGMVD
jgi:hypothetical protein